MTEIISPESLALGDNLLALFQLIYDWRNPDRIKNDLIHVALREGFPKGEIHDALNSDRGLVIYEP